MLLRSSKWVVLDYMKNKIAKTCEACKQRIEGDLRTIGRQIYCSAPECQRERRRRSQRRRRAAKLNLNQPKDETLSGGNKYSKLQSASLEAEADIIT